MTGTADVDPGMLGVLQDAEVQHVALSTAGLSQKSIRSTSEVIDLVQDVDGLPRPP
ncbi:hypothetical protein ABZ114_19460 [Streptomyces albidoflavus]|uniref:hypothetical protein n=1 Tax=Streptomyces albidoflavus TaxID=1886 RepID=UPI0033AD12F9